MTGHVDEPLPKCIGGRTEEAQTSSRGQSRRDQLKGRSNNKPFGRTEKAERCPLRDTQRGSPQRSRYGEPSLSAVRIVVQRAGGLLQPFLRRRVGGQPDGGRKKRLWELRCPSCRDPAASPSRPRVRVGGGPEGLYLLVFLATCWSCLSCFSRCCSSCRILFAAAQRVSYFLFFQSRSFCVFAALVLRSVRYLCTFFFGSPHFLGICFCVILVCERYILASSRCLTTVVLEPADVGIFSFFSCGRYCCCGLGVADALSSLTLYYYFRARRGLPIFGRLFLVFIYFMSLSACFP